MENFDASNSTPNGPSFGSNSFTGGDQFSDYYFSQAWLADIPDMQSPVLNPTPDVQGMQPMGNLDGSSSALSGLPLGLDPLMGLDQPFDFSQYVFPNGPNMVTPPATPAPAPANPAVPVLSFDTDEPWPPGIEVKVAASESEVVSLHAQLPEEYHRVALKLDEALHGIMALLKTALAALDKRNIDNMSCLDHLDALVTACKDLQEDGALLIMHDQGGYGVLCQTFQQVGYRFDFFRIYGVIEDWFEVFLGMRERIARMQKDKLYKFAKAEGARVLGLEPVRGGAGKTGKGLAEGGEAAGAKWERDAGGRLIKR